MPVTFKSLVEGGVFYVCSKTSKGWVVSPLEVLSVDNDLGRVLIRKAGSPAAWHYAPFFKEQVRRVPPEWVLDLDKSLICYMCKGSKAVGHKPGCTHPKAPIDFKPWIDIDPDPSKPPMKLKVKWSPKSSVPEKIRTGFYDNRLPWSDKRGAKHEATRKAYLEEEKRLSELFKQDAFERLGLIVKLKYYDPTKYPMCHCTGEVGNVLYKHPKAELLFAKAQCFAKGAKIKDIWETLIDLVGLVELVR